MPAASCLPAFASFDNDNPKIQIIFAVMQHRHSGARAHERNHRINWDLQ